MRYSILILLMLISCLSSQAAKSVYILSGKVTDGLGEPISFATIALEHTKFAAAVNIEGDYVLKVPQGIYTGKVTAVGFKPYNFKIKISKDTVLNIRLDEDVVVLQGVSVYGKTTAKKLEEGAFSVNAVEITPNVNKMVTLNDLVDRTAGVKVRREGGMGSEFDLTINGMSGNSIRYFIDGVPLETKGSGLTLDNVPINTVERVELYKGVVPSYLSSDALGGAVNIVTKRKRQNFLDASYAIGSFHTHSGDITGQYIIPGTVIAIHPTFSINYSKNDYKMRGVEVWSEEEDRYIFTDKRRFHDDYFSLFGQIEAGVSDVKWTDRFFVGVTYNKLDK
ncbi:MAG: TonB-dependent receptor plug domain-containing protein, partial [Muribaculaceae bacterium]|nr:TonB-dependent receptor plug domain-containing protein [Muribaculaceae bacterium]